MEQFTVILVITIFIILSIEWPYPRQESNGMKNRYKMSKKTSRRKFKKTAGRTNKMNRKPRPMRGGTRL